MANKADRRTKAAPKSFIKPAFLSNLGEMKLTISSMAVLTISEMSTKAIVSARNSHCSVEILK